MLSETNLACWVDFVLQVKCMFIHNKPLGTHLDALVKRVAFTNMGEIMFRESLYEASVSFSLFCHGSHTALVFQVAP